MGKMIIVCYDNHIDIDELNDALQQFKKPTVFEVQTMQSNFAVAVGENGCTQEDAQKAWDKFATEE